MLTFYLKLFIPLFVCTIVIKNIAAKPVLANGTSLSLYDDNDSNDIVVLDANNFKDTIYGTHNAWVVEFYVHWCGYCQRFAPIWKALSHDIAEWKDIVNVAVINCAIESNSDLCREYKARPWPHVKYFSAYSVSSTIGEQLNKEYDQEFMRHTIIARLNQDQKDGKGQDVWPSLSSYSGSNLQDLWSDVAKNVEYQFLIFETDKSYVGSEVILDLHKIPNIRIQRVTPDNSIWTKYNNGEAPSLIVIDRQNTKVPLKLSSATRRGIEDAIEEYLQSKGVNIEHQKKGGIPSRIIPEEEEKVKVIPQKVQEDFVHIGDLKAAVKNSLENEIIVVDVIDGDKMQALKDYLKVLSQYFPLKNENSTYLTSIHEALENKSAIKGEELKDYIKSLESLRDEFFDKSTQWMQCKGSSSQYRGYPCSLWTLFHTLTVSYADTSDEQTDEPAKILSTMYNYIKNFFGCSGCAQHFVAMAEERKYMDVKTRDEAVLWLWKAHNQVNQRLAGDITEDPQYPKMQYPMKVHCTQCKNNDDTWNEVEVLKYLKNKYNRTHIHYDDNTTVTEKNSNKFESVENFFDKIVKLMKATDTFIKHSTAVAAA